MNCKWTEEDIEDLKIGVSIGLTHKDIGEIMGRTRASIYHKASRLQFKSLNKKLKTTREYKKELLEKFFNYELLEKYKGKNVVINHKHKLCNFIWKVSPTSILSGHGCPKCAGLLQKTTESYKKELHIKRPNYIILENYINNKTKILHKHKTCNYIFSITPDKLLNRHQGCPICNIRGFSSKKPGTLYCIYFPSLDLYKIGISNKYKRRLKEFGVTLEIVFLIYFNSGKDARRLELKLLENLKSFLINTGQLRSGNTETFRI